MKKLETHTLNFYLDIINRGNVSYEYQNKILFFVIHLLTRDGTFRFSRKFKSAMRNKLIYLHFCGTVDQIRVSQLEEDLRIRSRCISYTRHVQCANRTIGLNNVYCDFHYNFYKIERHQMEGFLLPYMTHCIARITAAYIW